MIARFFDSLMRHFLLPKSENIGAGTDREESPSASALLAPMIQLSPAHGNVGRRTAMQANDVMQSSGAGADQTKAIIRRALCDILNIYSSMSMFQCHFRVNVCWRNRGSRGRGIPGQDRAARTRQAGSCLIDVGRPGDRKHRATSKSCSVWLRWTASSKRQLASRKLRG